MAIHKDFVNGVLYGISAVRVTAYYGDSFPVNGTIVKHHNGVDMTPIAGVNPITRGRVRKVAYDNTRGHYIIIEHGDGYESSYMHLETNSITIKEGSIVDRAVMIGKVGKSGTVTGAHLHLGMTKNGVYVDPLPFLQGKQIVPPYQEVIMTRPLLPTLKVKVSQLNYRDKPNGIKMGQLELGEYPYLGKSQSIGGYEWAQILLEDKLVYCALNTSWNEIKLIEIPKLHTSESADGRSVLISLDAQIIK